MLGKRDALRKFPIKNKLRKHFWTLRLAGRFFLLLPHVTNILNKSLGDGNEIQKKGKTWKRTFPRINIYFGKPFYYVEIDATRHMLEVPMIPYSVASSTTWAYLQKYVTMTHERTSAMLYLALCTHHEGFFILFILHSIFLRSVQKYKMLNLFLQVADDVQWRRCLSVSIEVLQLKETLVSEQRKVLLVFKLWIHRWLKTPVGCNTTVAFLWVSIVSCLLFPPPPRFLIRT